MGCPELLRQVVDNVKPTFHIYGHVHQVIDKMIINQSERPVDARAVKNMNHSPTDNFKSRDASASKKGVRKKTKVQKK